MSAVPPFEIVVTAESGEALRVAVSGELDIATVPRLRAEARRVIRRTSRLVLDLAGVSFIDSTGLSLLVGLRDEARAGGVALDIVASPAVLRLVELCALQDQLPLRG